MPGFDPDAYLAKAPAPAAPDPSGFDPDAYLKGAPAAPAKPVPLYETALGHAANGLVLGGAPNIMGLYEAGGGSREEPSYGLGAVADVAAGLWRTLTGDKKAEEVRKAAADRERADLDRTLKANPKTGILSEVLAGAPAAALVAPAAPAATLLGRAGQAGIAGAKFGAMSGAARSETLADVPGNIGKDATAGLLAGPLLQAGAEGTGAGLQWLGRKASGLASEAARRSTGATQVDITKLTRENPNRPAQVGDALLNEKIRLRSPETIGTDAKLLRRETGQEIGSLKTTLDASGPSVDAAKFVAEARKDVLRPLEQDIAQQVPGHGGMPTNPAAERVALYLKSVEDKAASTGGKLTAEETHTLRKNLDTLIRGVNKSQDPSSTVVKDAFNSMRGMLDDELGAAMQRGGLGAQWSEANRRFSLGADIGKLAKKGNDRRLGNNAVFGFTQQVAGMGPGSVLGAMSSPDDRVAGALGGALAGAAGVRALQNYGAPATARLAQQLARALSAAPVSRAVNPEVAALVQAMERRYPGLGLMPAAADQDSAK